MKNKNFFIFFIVTVIFIFTLFIINYISQTKKDYINISEKMLYQQAITLYNNIINTRTWSSNHNGVYVLSDDKLKPNKYLEDNHAYTNDGKLLIKINPAWMTRQISEISNKKEQYYFRITSLNPINPDNFPDKFEQKALTYLKKSKNKEFYTNIENNKYNFLGELKVEESCLSCHKSQGYKIGDSMGGLRISLPINIYSENSNMITSKTNILYFITFFTSLAFIFIITFTIKSIYKRELNILKLNKSLENKVKKRTQELSQANEKLMKTSVTDFLTGLPNRRYFFETTSKIMNQAKRDSIDMSILCIDIDFFKKVNDTHGHQVGDEVLKFVSHLMQKQIRSSDIVARTGGEEFCIVLNNTNEKGAFTLAEKIRKLLKEKPFTHPKKELTFNVSISIGIASLDIEDDELDDLIAKADEALYVSKESGRNKTTLYSYKNT